MSRYRDEDRYFQILALIVIASILILAAGEGRCEEQGPPPPKVYTNCPVGSDCGGSQRHDRVLRYVAIQTAAGAFDIWATGYCVAENPKCYETNPLGKTAEQRIALKAATIAMFAIGANELDKRGHKNAAIGTTVVGVMLQTFLGVRAIRMGRQAHQ